MYVYKQLGVVDDLDLLLVSDPGQVYPVEVVLVLLNLLHIDSEGG